MSDAKHIVDIEIVCIDGLYMAAPKNKKNEGPFWGVTSSHMDVPSLLRNTADALETIKEASPDARAQLPGFWPETE